MRCKKLYCSCFWPKLFLKNEFKFSRNKYRYILYIHYFLDPMTLMNWNKFSSAVGLPLFLVF
jgi:hypothetical protein